MHEKVFIIIVQIVLDTQNPGSISFSFAYHPTPKHQKLPQYGLIMINLLPPLFIIK